jgi:hypothetical protein
LITAISPTTSAAGANIPTVTLTCANTACQGDALYLMAAFAPAGQCGTAAKREAAALVATGTYTLTNVVLRANQVYKLCWYEPLLHSSHSF